MTTKIATVANLAFHAFQQHSIRAATLGPTTTTTASTTTTTTNTTTTTTTSSTSSSSSTTGNMNNGLNDVHTCTNGNSPTHCDRPISPNHSSFNKKNYQLSDALNRLLACVHLLTPKDVGFDVKLISDSTNISSAPVAYVHIMENEVFSMGIFILKPGSRIPLHDHPGMYGILKVLTGSVRCRSFTRLKNVQSIIDLKNFHHNQTSSSLLLLSSVFDDSKWQLTDLIIARPHQDTVLSTDHQPCLLFPIEGNLHEITPVDGPAVFLDILAPPYDHDLGTRECRFYKEIIIPSQMNSNSILSSQNSLHNNNNNNSINEDVSSSTIVDFSDSGDLCSNQSDKDAIVYLIETNQPSDYWCESAEYNGPSVV
ncbi:unnamed protein product [Schistosoma turkestanicum]|nr:unnamed protein product [Schistosoma turkestanicum]